MAFDGIYLYSLVQQLKKSILNSKIDKISQPEKDEIILTFRKDRKNLKLLLSASSKYPRVQITNIQKENPLSAPLYLMVLRKYLIGGKIVDIIQKDGDRIFIMKIEASDELGFNSEYSLIAEIMGRHSNITLIRNRDNKILECIKHITPDLNTYRLLLPGLEYKEPPASKRLNPFNFKKEEISSLVASENIEINEEIFSKLFTGVSKPISKELFRNFNEEFSLDTLINKFSAFIKDIDSNIKFSIYMDKNRTYKDFYCLPLYSGDEGIKSIEYDDPWSLMDFFYSQKDKRDRLHNRSLSLQRLITTNLDRCYKKENLLIKTIEESKSKEDYRIKGDLLTSYIYNAKKGDKELQVLNYYNSDEEEYVTIPLDEHKTPSENVQFFYKKYNKMKKAEEGALEQIEKNKIEISYLNSVLTNLINCDNYGEIEEVKGELVETGYIKFKRNSKDKRRTKKLSPLHFKTSDGIDVYVGKNNLQNDELSLKSANKNHLWFHTKDIPGSHVILCTNELLDNSIEEAAKIAAFYSKSKDSSKVPVDYTYVKNLKKPQGSKPGMVIYHTNWTIFVDPTDPNALKESD